MTSTRPYNSMSLQGPLVIVAEDAPTGLADRLGSDGAFPVVWTRADQTADAVAAAQPSAILLADTEAAGNERVALLLTETITARMPIVPVIACASVDQEIPYREALPLPADASADMISTRISSALRVRELHAAVLRRAELAKEKGQALPSQPTTDPLEDACIIVAGRGRDYPGIATAVAERAGLIGAFSIEIAARYLKARDADGLLIADGFNPWNVGALLTVLSEDSRFRDLPVGILGQPAPPTSIGLIHTIHATDPQRLVARLAPLARLHAFEARLRRLMESFDSNGVIDPVTGLHVTDSFLQALDHALRKAEERGTGLSIARFVFDGGGRMKADAARLVSKLIRGADFACQDDDGSVLVVFTATDLKDAHIVARRIASVLKHTMLAPGSSATPTAPDVILAARKADDDIATLLARVSAPAVAAE
ncbi:MAG: GGDEF domain-containing protein [Pseudorhodoplanes sp.]|nr:GGDEF domain-containing protein [Pseudorhodoplanes sp.]